MTDNPVIIGETLDKVRKYIIQYQKMNHDRPLTKTIGYALNMKSPGQSISILKCKGIIVDRLYKKSGDMYEFTGVTTVRQKDVPTLQQRLEALEKRVAELERITSNCEYLMDS